MLTVMAAYRNKNMVICYVGSAGGMERTWRNWNAKEEKMRDKSYKGLSLLPFDCIPKDLKVSYGKLNRKEKTDEEIIAVLCSRNWNEQGKKKWKYNLHWGMEDFCVCSWVLKEDVKTLSRKRDNDVLWVKKVSVHRGHDVYVNFQSRALLFCFLCSVYHNVSRIK